MLELLVYQLAISFFISFAIHDFISHFAKAVYVVHLKLILGNKALLLLEI